MLIKLSGSCRKFIAVILFTIFYTNFVLGAYSEACFYTSLSANKIQIEKYSSKNNSPKLNESFTNGYKVIKAVDKAFEINKVEVSKKPKTGGPIQPEATSFQSVNSNNMVDLFTGDFSYNIPLLDVGGYPINLFYRSGITMDQDASWVGLGWNINPGSITRNMRGLPDDFQGDNDKITKVTSMKDNRTVGATIGADVEVFGFMGFQGSYGIFKNTYRGWGAENSIGTSVDAGFATMGRLTANLSINNNTQDGLTISPGLDLGLSNRADNEKNDNGVLSIGGGFSFNSRSGLHANLSTGVNLSLGTVKNQSASKSNGLQADLYHSSISFVSPTYVPTVSHAYTNSAYTFILKIGSEQLGGHPAGFVRGFVSSQELKDADTIQVLPAYGYLNFQQAHGNTAALLDFNREKELAYREKPEYPNIAVPFYTYDCFSINSEGTGGMFRPYRSDIGYIFDHAVTTRDNSDRFSVDIGVGNVAHAGANLELTRANTTGGAWTENNVMAKTVAFKESDSNFQTVYFRNPGEKTINTKDFYSTIGNDDVVTVGLYQSGSNLSTTSFLKRYNKDVYKGSTLLTPANTFKSKRDKRSEVITYLNATEAAEVGLDKSITTYSLNKWGTTSCTNIAQRQNRVGGIRQPNHISEIDVLNKDGKRYVYGIPVYNKFQDEITYSIKSTFGNKQTGLAPYNNSDDQKHNGNGIDEYYNRERTPAYASSFLLTGVLSSDFVDVTGDGITDDDLGDAIKFNYTQVADSINSFSWRTPYSNQVSYNEGLQSYSRDDKGSYIYGEKELWYLNSVESKNMVAQFIVESRPDLRTISKQGVIATTSPAKRLKEIRLYSKADFIKDSTKAKPIKTVHFDYDSSLCKNAAQSNVGKLTLTKVWFTYNGNETKPKNPYVFNYKTSNPNYDNRSFDRWGTYKPATDNPHGTLTNAEFPYAIQDSVKANQNAAAWTLDSIRLPSGGRMKIEYESDDYAYVQDKRAMQMFNVIGLSIAVPATSYANNGQSNDLQNNLYNFHSPLSQSQDNLYVGIKVPKSVSSKTDVYNKYLNGIKKLYFRLKVEMPTNEWGSGYEYVPTYADIDDASSDNYGYLTNDPTIIWVKLKGTDLRGEGTGDFSPLAKAAIQFLRLNLPSKAYPGSETDEDFTAFDAVLKLANIGGTILNAVSSFDRQAREDKYAIRIDADRSWVRLNNPEFKKYGGGLRVKKIKIYDNWYDMTSHAQKEAIYGQEYDYTTRKNINGEEKIISSGVASYEPMLGNEENPWRLPVEYIDKVAPLAPVTMGYSETPFGENLFPAPIVGYSQVRVKSINIKGTRSANGFEETKFYTSYDFPTLVDNSMLRDGKQHYSTSISNFLKVNVKHFLAMSQGFKIELNDMHGKLRSQATYAQTDSLNPINYTENFYKVDDQFAETKHLKNIVSSVNPQGVIDTTTLVGKDIELMMDMRQQNSLTQAYNSNFDIDAFVVWGIPIIIPNLIPLPQREENRFLSAATTKVINRYGILDSVVVIDKGSRVTTENLLYDSETGDPVLTNTKNEFNDTLYSFSYPAYWAYKGMGTAYKNIESVFGKQTGTKLTITNGLLHNNLNYPALNSYFESGDELLIHGKRKIGLDSFIDCSGVKVYRDKFDPEDSYTKAWVVDLGNLDSSSLTGNVFIERNGTPFTGIDLDIKVVRSGFRNVLDASIGSVTSLKSPMRTVATKSLLLIDSSNSNVSTSAATYLQKWKVKDARQSYTSSNDCACSSLKPFFDYLIFSHRLFTQQSANVTVASLITDASAQGYSINVSQCGLLSTNLNGLFYALTTDSVATYYSAKVGNDTVQIKADNNREVHFSEIISNTCTANNQVTYHDPNISPCLRHSLDLRDGYDNISCMYRNCEGSITRVTVSRSSNSGHMNICAIQGSVDPDEGLDFYEDIATCSTNTSPASDTTIHLSILSCTACHETVCYSPVTDTLLNPYTSGILGNWRLNKSFVYSSSRRENNLSAQTNLRKDGTIPNYIPYWGFSSGLLVATQDTTNWIWNSQSTLYNKKGLEIENKDPLNRYNAGLYGYDDNLPIAVTQNAKYQQQYFDGFEDYNYNDKECSEICPLPRNPDFNLTGSRLTDSVSHSGKYALRLNAHDSDIIVFPIANTKFDNQRIIAKVDTLTTIDTIVSPQGSGLPLTTYAYGKPTGYQGYIQANISGYYTIQSSINHDTDYYGSASSQGYQLEVNGISNGINGSTYNTVSVINVHLLAGQKAPISIFTNAGTYFSGSLSLSWSRSAPCAIGLTGVPTINLYSSNNPDNSVSYSADNPHKLTGIITDSSSLIPTFQLSKGDSIVFSAWVKEEQDCLCQTFQNNKVIISFKDASNNVTNDTAYSTGNIIEGWQQYNHKVKVPANCVSASLKLLSSGNTKVYYDDIRLHPFNALMKSFVYDPVSLRLMAEMDENNYASFYEYDDDGTLVRVKKETEKGIQTIKETRKYLTEK